MDGFAAPVKPSKGGTGQIGGGGIHDHAACHESTAPEQHTKQHIFTIGECDFDRPFAATEANRSVDHKASLAVSPRIADDPAVRHIGDTNDLHIRAPLQRVEPKPHPSLPVFCEIFEPEGMKRGGTGPGIDLGLDRRYTDLWKRDPFTPPDL